MFRFFLRNGEPRVFVLQLIITTKAKYVGYFSDSVISHASWQLHSWCTRRPGKRRFPVSSPPNTQGGENRFVFLDSRRLLTLSEPEAEQTCGLQLPMSLLSAAAVCSVIWMLITSACPARPGSPATGPPAALIAPPRR